MFYKSSFVVKTKWQGLKTLPLLNLKTGCGGTRTHDQLIKSQLRYQLRHAPEREIFKIFVSQLSAGTLPCSLPLKKILNGSDFFSAESTAPRKQILNFQIFVSQLSAGTLPCSLPLKKILNGSDFFFGRVNCTTQTNIKFSKFLFCSCQREYFRPRLLREKFLMVQIFRQNQLHRTQDIQFSKVTQIF